MNYRFEHEKLVERYSSENSVSESATDTVEPSIVFCGNSKKRHSTTLPYGGDDFRN